MKKLLICLCCFIVVQNSFTQNKTDSLKVVLAATTDPIKRFDLFSKIGEEYFSSGNNNLDSASCLKMLQIAQQLNNDSLLAISYNFVGNLFLFNTGDYSKSLEFFFKGIPLAQKTKDKRRLSSLYIDISIVYENLGNPDEQIKYIRKAEAALPDNNSPMYNYMLRQVQYNYSRYFLYIQKPDSAMHYTQALNETNLRLRSFLYETYAQMLLAGVYEQLNDKELADFHFKRANAQADSMQYSYVKFIIKPAYINFLLQNDKIASAHETASQLLKTGVALNNYDFKQVAAGFLRSVYDSLHQTDSAYYYARLESAFRDSVFSKEKTNKIQSLVFSEQLRISEEEAKTKQEAEQRKQNIQYALIALGIITFILLFLLLSRQFIIHSKVVAFFGVIALLIVFEFLNLLLHPFLERITHHSPVLMLLALVCIAALLVPLHHKLEKWATHKLVEKNKQIRLAGAKKTIRLLSDEELEKNK
jgi:tetratricopeptide (TPR) repeat protein